MQSRKGGYSVKRTLRFKYILYGFIYEGQYKGSYQLDMRGKQPCLGGTLGYVYPPIEIDAGNLQEMYSIFLNKYRLVLKKRTNDHWYGYTPEELQKNKKCHCAVFEIMRR